MRPHRTGSPLSLQKDRGLRNDPQHIFSEAAATIRKTDPLPPHAPHTAAPSSSPKATAPVACTSRPKTTEFLHRYRKTAAKPHTFPPSRPFGFSSAPDVFLAGCHAPSVKSQPILIDVCANHTSSRGTPLTGSNHSPAAVLSGTPPTFHSATFLCGHWANPFLVGYCSLQPQKRINRQGDKQQIAHFPFAPGTGCNCGAGGR